MDITSLPAAPALLVGLEHSLLQRRGLAISAGADNQKRTTAASLFIQGVSQAVQAIWNYPIMFTSPRDVTKELERR